MKLSPHLSLIFIIALVAPGCRCAGGGSTGGGPSGEHIQVLDQVELESGGNLVLVRVGDRTLLIGTSENDPPTMLGDVDPETLGYTLENAGHGASDSPNGNAWERGDLVAQRTELGLKALLEKLLPLDFLFGACDLA